MEPEEFVGKEVCFNGVIGTVLAFYQDGDTYNLNLQLGERTESFTRITEEEAKNISIY